MTFDVLVCLIVSSVPGIRRYNSNLLHDPKKVN